MLQVLLLLLLLFLVFLVLLMAKSVDKVMASVGLAMLCVVLFLYLHGSMECGFGDSGIFNFRLRVCNFPDKLSFHDCCGVPPQFRTLTVGCGSD